MARSRQLLACSFCSKSQKDVKKLIANDRETSYICDECIDKCSAILITTEKTAPEKKKKSKALPTPRLIKEFLDQYVIGQDYTKEILSVAVYNHYKRLDNPIIEDVEIDKSNILLCGPTGVGKTLLIQSIAKFIDVPVAICDATSLTEAGYVGDDVESLITRLLQTADYDAKKAERGIILIDECDKKRSRENANSSSRDVAGEGVQQALLKLLEGTEIMVPVNGRKSPNVDMVKINTKNILFVLSGAFVGLENLLEKEDMGIGFGATVERKKTNRHDILKRIEPEHLIKFGLIPELIGRVPVITMLDELNEDQLVQILTEPKNAIVKQYSKMFGLEGIDLRFEPEALTAVAKLARARKTNGRALRGVLEARLLRTQFNLPDLREQGAEAIIVHAATITDGTEPEVVYKAVTAAQG